MSLGQKIKKLRTDMGLTQKDLADQVHVTFQTVSKWEKDENEPDVSTLKILAKLFDISLDELLDIQNEEIVEHVFDDKHCHKCGKEFANNDGIFYHGEYDSSGKRVVKSYCLDCYRKVMEKEKQKEEMAKQQEQTKSEPVSPFASKGYSYRTLPKAQHKDSDTFGAIIAIFGIFHAFLAILFAIIGFSIPGSDTATVLKMFSLISFLVNILVSPILCAIDAGIKNRNWLLWLFLGFLLNDIALIIIGFSSYKED